MSCVATIFARVCLLPPLSSHTRAWPPSSIVDRVSVCLWLRLLPLAGSLDLEPLDWPQVILMLAGAALLLASREPLCCHFLPHSSRKQFRKQN